MSAVIPLESARIARERALDRAFRDAYETAQDKGYGYVMRVRLADEVVRRCRADHRAVADAAAEHIKAVVRDFSATAHGPTLPEAG